MEQIQFSNLRKTETARLEQGGVTVTADTTVTDGKVARIEGNMTSEDGRNVHFYRYLEAKDYRFSRDGSASLLAEKGTVLDGFENSLMEHYGTEDQA